MAASLGGSAEDAIEEGSMPPVKGLSLAGALAGAGGSSPADPDSAGGSMFSKFAFRGKNGNADEQADCLPAVGGGGPTRRRRLAQRRHPGLSLTPPVAPPVVSSVVDLVSDEDGGDGGSDDSGRWSEDDGGEGPPAAESALELIRKSRAKKRSAHRSALSAGGGAQGSDDSGSGGGNAAAEASPAPEPGRKRRRLRRALGSPEGAPLPPAADRKQQGQGGGAEVKMADEEEEEEVGFVSETRSAAQPPRSITADDAAVAAALAAAEEPEEDVDEGDGDYRGGGDEEEGEEGGSSGDAVLLRCEEVATRLRGALGLSAGSDRYAAVDYSPPPPLPTATAGSDAAAAAAAATGPEDGSSGQGQQQGLVTLDVVARACGEGGRAGSLKDYQMVGVNFLLLHARRGAGGCVLADEMGLGKTAQTICFLGTLRELDGDRGPHLVVVPPSLLDNWLRELRSWCPALRVAVYYGSNRSLVRARLNSWRRAYMQAGRSPGPMSEAQMDGMGADVADDGGSPGGAHSEGSGPIVIGSSDDDQEEGSEEEDVALVGPCPEAPFDVLVTCYTLFERVSPEQRLDRGFLGTWAWSHCLMDEAHALKNAAATRTQKLRKIARLARRRVMLTGTPLQNDLLELHNLLQLLLPDIFDSDDGRDAAEELLAVQKQDKEAASELAVRMRTMLGPFLLRRLKSEVARQLTDKVQRVEAVQLTSRQRALYDDAVNDLRNEVNSANQGKRSGKRGGGNAAQRLGARRISSVFTHLRKVAQHPLLVRGLYSDQQLEKFASLAHSRGVFGPGASLARIQEELGGYSDAQLDSLARSSGGKAFESLRLDPEVYMDSGKAQVLSKLLPQLQAAGSRPLVFSQWTSVLDVLEVVMDRLGLSYVRLDGSTAVEERMQLVDTFNDESSGVFAFLLSTRAGGQGLNLTGADTVILHDVDFNPQVDRQAEDRCHRIGQSRPVTVHRLVASGTVDERIHALAQTKLELDSAVLDGITAGATKGAAGSSDTKAMGAMLHELLTGEEGP